MNYPINNKQEERFQNISKVIGILVLIIGITVLSGWILDIPFLKNPSLIGKPMKVNASICFIFITSSFLFFQIKDQNALLKSTSIILSAITVIYTLLTFFEYIFGIDFHIGQLLIKDSSDSIITSASGRLAPGAAIELFLIGSVLFLQNFKFFKTHFLSIQIITVFSGSFAFFVLLGYLFDASTIYTVNSYSLMTFLVALCSILLSIGILLSNTGNGFMRLFVSDTSGGIVLRTIFPLAAIMIITVRLILFKVNQVGYISVGVSSCIFITIILLLTGILLWRVSRGLAVADLKQRTSTEEIKTLNDDLQLKIQQYDSVNKELEAFTYSVSHDLRAPLRAINGYSKILIEDYLPQLDEQALPVLNSITGNAVKMGQLIDDLLAFSRLGRKEMVKYQLDMNKIVSNVINEIMKQYPNREIEFKVEPLQSCNADSNLINQVWTNLISNAVKYSKHVELPVIEIGSYQKGKEVVYFIKDNGAGFDMQYVNKLFCVFQRLHKASEFEGTGVGLAIVKRIVDRHSGQTWAVGKENEGAAFYYTIPIN